MKLFLSRPVLYGFSRGKAEFLTIGHRGASGYVLENTIPAIERALDLGCNAIEIDVFSCKTGEIIVHHDSSFHRLAELDTALEELTLEEIKQITLKGGYTVPTLEEVVQCIAGRAILNIELKGGNTAVGVDRVIREACSRSKWKTAQFIVSSFNLTELLAFRRINRNIRIAVLTEKDPLESLMVAGSLKAFAINSDYRNLTTQNVALLKKRGYRVYAWTVNDTSEINRMIYSGVDGIFSDYPDRISYKRKMTRPFRKAV